MDIYQACATGDLKFIHAFLVDIQAKLIPDTELTAKSGRAVFATLEPIHVDTLDRG